MRPLPRIHAITDAAILAAPDFGVRAAAIAAAGSAVALHARGRDAAANPDTLAVGGRALAAAASRMLALARPPEAAVFVNGRPDIAAALEAHGVQLGSDDLTVADARRIYAAGWIGRSVHSAAEAEAAIAEGADFLIVGNVYETDSHPSRPPAGLALIRETAALGKPVIAIGGITVERAPEVRAAGAYGAAAIRALWHAPDPAAAALAMLEPWMDDR